MQRIAKIDPGAAYLGYDLALPKTSGVPITALRRMLTADVNGVLRDLYHETETHLHVPREFILREQYQGLGVPVYDIRTRLFQRVFLEPKKVPYDNQIAPLTAMRVNGSGVLGLACGRGKTTLGLHYAAWLQVPTIIIVDTQMLIEQWTERIHEHLKFDGRVGLIQGKTLDWDHSLVVASITTLGKIASDLPFTVRQHFGLAIYDEVHHLSARTFLPTASLFAGRRIGLSATPTREDHLEFIYQAHLGPVFYEDYSTDLVPKMYFYRVGTRIDYRNPDVLDVNGEFNVPRALVWLGGVAERNALIASLANDAIAHGRTVLILVHGYEHALRLGELIPNSGVCVSSVGQRERFEITQSCRAIITTMRIGREAMDNWKIDVVIIGTPFKAEGAFQQGVGRGLRPAAAGMTKKAPIGIVVEDTNIGFARSSCRKLRQYARDRGYEIQTIDDPSLRPSTTIRRKRCPA